MVSGVRRPKQWNWKAAIRGGLVSLGLLSLPPAAFAADLDYLRGTYDPAPPPPVGNLWQGFYLGGHAGYASLTANFSSGVSDLVANILRDTIVENEFTPSDWVNLPKQSTARASYGGFIGYNMQYDEAVIGIEGSYSRTSMSVVSSDTIARNVTTSDGYSNDVAVTGSASLHLTDYGTLRIRGGWALGTFMPYGFVGAALGRATLIRSASVSILAVDADPACIGPPDTCLPSYSFSQSQSDIKRDAIAYGWTAGGGLDWAMTPNIFLRSEIEYVGFPNFYGTAVGITTGRLGAGLKF